MSIRKIDAAAPIDAASRVDAAVPESTPPAPAAARIAVVPPPAPTAGAPTDAIEQRPAGASAGPILGTVPQTRGRLALHDARADAAVARSISHLATLGISPASVRAATVDVDGLGMTHVRFDRLHEGARVFGEQLIVHLRGGAVASVTGRLEPSAVPEGAAVRASAMAREQARRVAAEAFGKPGGRVLSDERVVFRGADGAWCEGWRVRVERLSLPDPRRVTYLVDGGTKVVVRQWNEIGGVLPPGRARTRGREPIDQRRVSAPADPAMPAPPPAAIAPPRARADDRTLYSGMVDLTTTTKGRSHVLLDPTRGGGIHTMDARNRPSPGKAVEITDRNDAWGEKTDSPRQRGAVDAQLGMATTYDLYRELLGVDSFDLKGGRMNGNVHVGNDYVNAYWDGSSMNYGDGDGKESGPLTTLDITGHEITHGLIENTAALEYSDESGGLNEAMSDIGGFLTEYWAAKKNPGLAWDWAVGEDAWTPGDGDPTDALRYIDDPTRDGYSVDHYSRYPEQTEVHGSSGIVNDAFYQLAEPRNEGKKPNSVSKVVVKDGIGPEKAGRIFFRALQFYMTSGCTFADARAATVQAATDLFGPKGVEVAKTREAWSAVGVEDPAPKVA